MMKKVFAIVLAISLVFALASCNRNKTVTPGDATGKIVPSEKKVAIVVAPKDQYPEDYIEAYALASEYPDKVIVKEYPDSRILKPGNPEIMNISEELASDESVGAIVYARATQFTTYAISSAKAVNPSIVTVCIEPEESIDKISDQSDLVLAVDWEKAAEEIVSAAKENGAEYFVMFSFNRHVTDNPFINNERGQIEAQCRKQGITFIYESSQDPTFSGGISKAQLYIKESVARLKSNNKISGSNVVLFSTDSSVQTTVIEAADANGYTYICPSFPTALNGIGEAYGVEYPDDLQKLDKYIKSLKSAAEQNSGSAKLFSYNFPLASSLLKTAVYCAFDILNGTTTSDNLAENVAARASTAFDSKKMTLSSYPEKTNVFVAYNSGFESVR